MELPKLNYIYFIFNKKKENYMSLLNLKTKTEPKYHKKNYNSLEDDFSNDGNLKKKNETKTSNNMK